MADQTLTPTSHKNSLDAITGSAIPILPAVGRVRRVGRAIVNWFLTSPSPQAYVRTDTAHESASRGRRESDEIRRWLMSSSQNRDQT